MKLVYLYAVYIKLRQLSGCLQHHSRGLSGKSVYNMYADVHSSASEQLKAVQKITVGVAAVYAGGCSVVYCLQAKLHGKISAFGKLSQIVGCLVGYTVGTCRNGKSHSIFLHQGLLIKAFQIFRRSISPRVSLKIGDIEQIAAPLFFKPSADVLKLH